MTAARADAVTAVPDGMFAESLDGKENGRVLLWGGAALVVLTAHLALFVTWRAAPAPAGERPAPPAVMIDLTPLPVPPQPLPAAASVPPPPAAVPEPAPSETPPPLPTPAPPLPAPPQDLPPLPAEATLPLPPPPPPSPPRRAALRASRPQTPPLPRAARMAPPAAAPVPPVATPAPPSPPAAAGGAARRDWQSRLLAHIARYKSYPALAQANDWQGMSVVRFTFQRDGTVIAAAIVQGSGHAVLDQAALATLRRASPLPPPPAGMPGDPLTLTLPLQFSLQPG